MGDDGDEQEVDGFAALRDDPYREHPYDDGWTFLDQKDYEPGGEFYGVEPPPALRKIGEVERKALAVDRSKLPGGVTGKEAKLFVQQSLGWTIEDMAEANRCTVDAIRGDSSGRASRWKHTDDTFAKLFTLYK